MSSTTAHPPSPGHLCPPWLSATLDNPIRALLHNPLTLLQHRVRPGQSVADFGCGPGFFTFPLCDLVGPEGQVFAIDIQPDMLRQIERKAEQRDAGNLYTTLYRPGKLQLPGKLDFVLMFWMLHEVSNGAQLVREIRELLKPGGTVLFAEPKLHVSNRVYQRELADFAAAGFHLREFVPVRFSRAALLEVAAEGATLPAASAPERSP